MAFETLTLSSEEMADLFNNHGESDLRNRYPWKDQVNIGDSFLHPFVGDKEETKKFKARMNNAIYVQRTKKGKIYKFEKYKTGVYIVTLVAFVEQKKAEPLNEDEVDPTEEETSQLETREEAEEAEALLSEPIDEDEEK